MASDLNDAQTECLWSDTLVSMQDRDTGSTEFGIWVAMFDMPIGQRGCSHDVGECSEAERTWPSGVYLVSTSELGFQFGTYYSNPKAGYREFDRIDDLYAEWMSEEL